MVEIFDDRIDISNPGGLVKGMSHRVGYIEKMGTGVTKMRKVNQG
jgi:predicted HTH transcriptional regulator